MRLGRAISRLSRIATRLATKKRPTVRRQLSSGVEILEGRELLSTFTVTNLNASGPGSVRRAVIDANTHLGADVIKIHMGAHTEAKIDAATTITYYPATSVPTQPVSGWQGIRGAGSRGQYLITGTSGANGLLFIGSIDGQGTSYLVNVPGAYNSSVYGPNILGNGQIQLVGSYKNSDYTTASVKVHGFLFQGTTADLPSGGTYTTIDYPGAEFNYVHSTMGGLVVGNYDGPTSSGAPLGPGKDYIYDIATHQFVASPVFPGSTSNTAYGIWWNGGTRYTIAGGYSDASVNNVANENVPIGQAYMVDYNSATGKFTHWKSYSYPTGALGASIVTHFEGISSVKKGVYTLVADSAQLGTDNVIQGSLVTVKRNSRGGFGKAVWTKLNDPSASGGVTSGNSVYGGAIVGIVIGSSTFSYQAYANR